MSDYQSFLESTLATQSDSIQSYELDSRKVWLKKASERHGLWLYTPLKWLAKIFNLGSITPVPNQGGSAAIQCEFKRIQQLKALGISTPNVLALSKKGILLEDVGSQRQSQVSQLDQKIASLKDHPEQQFDLFHQAIQAIRQIHQHEGYLSEAFARNILVDEQNQFTFIDFPQRWQYGYMFWVSMLCTGIVGLLKAHSSHACPWYMTHETSTGFIWDFSATAGHCFPGGHASTGFALVTGYFVYRLHQTQRAWFYLIAAMIIGFAMGWAQMMRGAHFLSHNLWTAWVCVAVNLVLYALTYKRHQALTNRNSIPLSTIDVVK